MILGEGGDLKHVKSTSNSSYSVMVNLSNSWYPLIQDLRMDLVGDVNLVRNHGGEQGKEIWVGKEKGGFPITTNSYCFILGRLILVKS